MANLNMLNLLTRLNESSNMISLFPSDSASRYHDIDVNDAETFLAAANNADDDEYSQYYTSETLQPLLAMNQHHNINNNNNGMHASEYLSDNDHFTDGHGLHDLQQQRPPPPPQQPQQHPHTQWQLTSGTNDLRDHTRSVASMADMARILGFADITSIGISNYSIMIDPYFTRRNNVNRHVFQFDATVTTNNMGNSHQTRFQVRVPVSIGNRHTNSDTLAQITNFDDKYEGTTETYNEAAHTVTSDANQSEFDYENNRDKCSICIEAFNNGDSVTKTLCGHKFHEACILHMINYQRREYRPYIGSNINEPIISCPNCRTIIEPKPQQPSQNFRNVMEAVTQAVQSLQSTNQLIMNHNNLIMDSNHPTIDHVDDQTNNHGGEIELLDEAQT